MSLQTQKYSVANMDCGGCAMKIETALRKINGVKDVAVSVTAGTLVITHESITDFSPIEQKIKGLGYPLKLFENAKKDDHDDHSGHSHELEEGAWYQTKKGKLTIYAGAALAVSFIIGKFMPNYAQIAFLLAMVVGLAPIAYRAFKAALAGAPFSIEMLMTIAAVGAIFINATEEAAVVVFLFLVGELLEGVATGKARASIKSLASLVPKTAFKIEANEQKEVSAKLLAINDIILIRPGDRIAADGIIIEGKGAIDEAPVTGESTPKRKGIGEAVFAGTINTDSVIKVQVTATAQDNTISRVIKLVEEAQESKAPTERFIDKFSKYYTPFVVLIALLVTIIPPLFFAGDWSSWIYKGLALLLIGCPCALVISTPAAIASALSNGARRGLLLKGGAVLEQLRTITLVAFDKTGTLTLGKPKVTDIIALNGTQSETLCYAAALEVGSSHPLATAILAKAADEKITPPNAENNTAHGGKGLSGTVEEKAIYLGSPRSANEIAPLGDATMTQIQKLNDEGKTVSILLVDKTPYGLIAMRDEPREDAKAGVEKLNSMGIKTIMLTGDNARTAKAIGAALSISEINADLLPQDKQRLVGEFKQHGFSVAKIGDGINDAPALAAADIGIAMGGGTDVALETADAAILHGRVKDVAAMISLSKQTMTNIWQNITLALGLKAVFLVTTIFGMTGLWIAILADTGATVLVTLNAMRLLTTKD